MTPAQLTAPEAMAMAYDKVREAFEIPECDRPGCPVCAKQYAEFKAAIAAISGQIREAALREAALHATCAFDDRPHGDRSGNPDYQDGYLDGTRAAAAKIKALISGTNHEPR